MNDQRILLAAMSRQLYEDIKFVTQQSPTQIVDDEGARAFNTLLGKTRHLYQNIEFVQDFQDWTPRTIKYKDALVIAGQLFAMLNQLTGRAVAPVRGGEGGSPLVSATPVAAGGGGNDPDEELYGQEVKAKRNPDGTIPFSLE